MATDVQMNVTEAKCRLSIPLPQGTIDSHMHIIPPDFTRFPLKSTAQYKPTPHTLADAAQFYHLGSGLGIESPRCVLTQVSIYGTDNSALLSGLAELGHNGRGVVECDPKTITVQQLETWWSGGVRGVRINLVSVGRSMEEDELRDTLSAYVECLVRHKLSEGKKWVVEMYLPLDMVPIFCKVLPYLEGGKMVRWCLDHFAGLRWKDHAPDFEAKDADKLYEKIPGLNDLVGLLTDTSLPEVFVKISAQYRVDSSYPSAESLGKLGAVGTRLIKSAEDRVVWASDWPHTRFGDVDSVPFVEACYEWCGNGAEGIERREKLFRLNAEVLWDMA